MHRLTLLSPTGVLHDLNNMVSSREVLDGQVTGEGGSEVVDSSWLVALEQEQCVEKMSLFWCGLLSHLWEESWSPFLMGKVCGCPGPALSDRPTAS